MATRIQMRHKQTGLVKNGFYGFSWTTFLFGFIPALFRRDFITFFGFFLIAVVFALMGYQVVTLGGTIAWAFIYNKLYTRKLIERGYEFAGSEQENALAASALGVVDSQTLPDELTLRQPQG